MCRSCSRSAPGCGSAASEIFDVDVGAESRVVGEVPPVVVRVLVDHDAVRVPQPAIDKWVVVSSNAEKEAIEPEALPASSAQDEHMPRSESAGEVSVRPRMIEMVVRIKTACM